MWAFISGEKICTRCTVKAGRAGRCTDCRPCHRSACTLAWCEPRLPIGARRKRSRCSRCVPVRHRPRARLVLALALAASVAAGESATPRTDRDRDDPDEPSRPIRPARLVASDLVDAPRRRVEHRRRDGAAADGGERQDAARRRPRSSISSTPTARRRCPRPTTTPAAGTPPKFECTFGTTLARLPAAGPGLPRPVVRRLQRHLHADPADERQLLHRGRHLGRRRLVQRRQPRSPASRRSSARTCTAASPTRSSAAPDAQADRRHHRAGAGAPGRARARHRAPTTSCTRPSARTATGSRTGGSRSTGDRCDRHDPELVPDDDDRLGAWGGGPKPSAFGCMQRHGSRPRSSFVTPGDGSGWATTSR